MKFIGKTKIAILGFIVWHWLCVIIILPPFGSNGSPSFWALKLARSYLTFVNQTQFWNMFCPEPPRVDSYISATIYFENGETKQFSFPRVSEQAMFSWSRHRWRKYQECLEQERSGDMGQDAARYVARQFKAEASHPTRVVLYLNERPVPPSRAAAASAAYSHKVLVTYPVKIEDMK
jgi:hypothetical protein